MLLLGIDCGTQGLKTIAWDSDGETLHASSQNYGLISGLPPGHKEQHPQDWIAALEACIQELATSVDLSRVAGIGVSGQQHGFVPLDDRGEVIRPAKLWNDTSTFQQCAEIMAAAGGPEAYQEVIGNLLPPGYTASKILWLRQNEPENYQRLKRILLPHDYLNLFLTGEAVTEAGDASGTGYFRVRERCWSKQALTWIDPEGDLETKLPRLLESNSPAGQLRSSLAQRWGMSPQVVVSSGGGDNMMGAIGSGNVREGILTVSLGTSGTLFAHSDTPVIDPRGEIAAFCSSTGGWLPLGCTMNVTVASEAVRHNILDVSFREFEDLLGAAPSGSDGLLLLPYLEGERMPDTPEGTGVLFGLRSETATPRHLARATVEGVTFGLRYGFDRLKELGVSTRQVCLIGGGSKSRVWRQIVADVFGVSVQAPRIEEGPAFGAVLQAAWCVQGGPIESQVDTFFQLDPQKAAQPQPAEVEAYESSYGLYCELSRQLRASSLFAQHRQLISS